MGALVAFETARAAVRRGLPTPLALIVSGRGAPQTTASLPQLHDRDEPGFVEALRDLGGTPEAVLLDPTLRDLLFPLLRADFALNETYRFEPGPVLDCPILVLGGTRDRRVPVADLDGWAEHSTGRTEIRLIGGGHFFVHERRAEVLGLIGQELAAWTS
jgi:medium-chain acyl-[acyl-carrier-protein] hydrolase